MRIHKLLGFVAQLVPLFYGDFFPGSLRKFLPLLPQIFSLIDSLAAASIISGDWSESKARAVINEAIMTVSDGAISPKELLELGKLILRLYNPIAAASSIQEAQQKKKSFQGFYKAAAEIVALGKEGSE